MYTDGESAGGGGRKRTWESWMFFERISRMRRMVASSDWRFRLLGGRRSMPLEIACGLRGSVLGNRKREKSRTILHEQTNLD